MDNKDYIHVDFWPKIYVKCSQIQWFKKMHVLEPELGAKMLRYILL